MTSPQKTVRNVNFSLRIFVKKGGLGNPFSSKGANAKWSNDLRFSTRWLLHTYSICGVGFPYYTMAGSPLHRETGKMVQENPGMETQGIWKFAKTQGICFVQLANALILKIQDIVIFSATFLKFHKSLLRIKLSQVSEIGIGITSSWTGKGQGICK